MMRRSLFVVMFALAAIAMFSCTHEKDTGVGAEPGTFSVDGSGTTVLSQGASSESQAPQAEQNAPAATPQQTAQTPAKTGIVGTFDTSFGNGGTLNIYTGPPGGDDGANSVVEAPGGKLIVVGADSHDTPSSILWQLLPDGSLDPAFGVNGAVKPPPPVLAVCPDTAAWGSDVVRLNSGRIVVASQCNFQNPSETHNALFGYTSAGQPDFQFGTSSFASVAYAGFNDHLGQIKMDASNRIVMGGSQHDGKIGSAAIWRYTDKGLPDATLGSGKGYVSLSLNPSDVMINAMDIDNTGKILLTGTIVSPGIEQNLLVMRINDDGTLDNTFGGTGHVTNNALIGSDNKPGMDIGNAIARDKNGDIYVAGTVFYMNSSSKMEYDLGLWHFGQDGTFKKFVSYGHNSGLDEEGWAILIDDAGLIFAGGFTTDNNGNEQPTIWKYTPDLALDSSFGTNGVFSLGSSSNGGDSLVDKMIFDSTGKIVATGLIGNRTYIWRIK